MKRKNKKSLMKSKDPMFYYETKNSYQEKEAYRKKSGSVETGKAVKSGLKSYHTFLIEKKNSVGEKICFEDYSKQNLKEYLFYLTDELKYANSTANQRLSLIRGLLEYAADLDDSVMPLYLSAKKIRKLTVPDKPIEYFSEQQIESMINAPDRKKKIGRRNCLILTIEYDCALRIHEVTLLQLRDVHLKGDDPKIMVAGKGGTYLPVPLTDKSAALLKDYIKEFHEDSAPETPLFYGMYGKEKKAISVDTINNLISQSIESCMKKGIEFPKRCISHMIRKSRAMHLYERGVPLPHIQQILRHKSLNTTSGFYAFATLKNLRHSLEKADKVREENKNKNWKKPGIREKLEEISK